MMGKIPPKGTIFSDLICTFATSCKILRPRFHTTKLCEILTWQNPGQLYVALKLIEGTKLFIYGIKNERIVIPTYCRDLPRCHQRGHFLHVWY